MIDLIYCVRCGTSVQRNPPVPCPECDGQHFSTIQPDAALPTPAPSRAAWQVPEGQKMWHDGKAIDPHATIRALKARVRELEEYLEASEDYHFRIGSEPVNRNRNRKLHRARWWRLDAIRRKLDCKEGFALREPLSQRSENG